MTLEGAGCESLDGGRFGDQDISSWGVGFRPKYRPKIYKKMGYQWIPSGYVKIAMENDHL